MSNRECRKTKVEAPPIVSKIRRRQRRLIEPRLQGHPLRVNAADLPRRRFLHLAASAAAFPAVSRDASAQSYPTRPITMIVSFAAGSGTDVTGRIIAERMRERLGQPIIIENIAGADGNIGTGRVARAPDGYVIDLGGFSAHVLTPLYIRFHMMCRTILCQFAVSDSSIYSFWTEHDAGERPEGIDRVAEG